MTDVTLASLAERVSRVERKIRRTTLAALFAALVAVIAVVAFWKGALPMDTMRAKRFVLFDLHDNRARGGMVLSESVGAPCLASLSLLDEKGKGNWSLYPSNIQYMDVRGQRIMMGDQWQDQMPGPSLVFIDRGRNDNATLVLSATGPTLALFDSNNNRRADLTVDEHGNPRFRMYDAWGKELFSAP